MKAGIATSQSRRRSKGLRRSSFDPLAKAEALATERSISHSRKRWLSSHFHIPTQLAAGVASRLVVAPSRSKIGVAGSVRFHRTLPDSFIILFYLRLVGRRSCLPITTQKVPDAVNSRERNHMLWIRSPESTSGNSPSLPMQMRVKLA